jgi:hypothetical protein
VITNATPLPLETLTVTGGRLVIPPLRTPLLLSIAHSVLPKLAEKLPLACAKALDAMNMAPSAANPNTDNRFIITPPLFLEKAILKQLLPPEFVNCAIEARLGWMDLSME